MPSGTTGGKPTKSHARSGPRPAVQSRTSLTRARGAGAAGAHHLTAGAAVRALGGVQWVVGAERPGELEPRGHLVDHDDRAGAHVARHGHRLDAEAASAVDEDALPEP